MDADSKRLPHNESDRNIGVIIGIVIFLLLFVFLVVVFIAFGISDHGTPEAPAPPVETGAFLSPCTTTSCQTGLICDGINFTCKFGTGMMCNDFTDCATGLICSGLCATGPIGGLDQLCPCDTGYLCVPQSNGFTLCKGVGGTTCGTDGDCVSSICESNGICATGAPNSFPCIINETCASLNCSLGFCQSTGIVTGVQGAACTDGCFGPGVTGAICNNTAGSPPLTCVCINGNGSPGTCIIANQGILSPCSTISACGEGLECLDITGNTCTGGSQSTCNCVFPYVDPNSQATGGICIGGMTSGANNTCVNNIGLGCDVGGVCASNLCGGNSIVSIYQFIGGSTGSILTSGVLFPGATETNVVFGFTGPTGTITPYKMLSSSTSNVDTIYLVDHTQGFLSVQYNVGSGVASAWNILIPYQTSNTSGNVTTTKTLIDVGYNGTTFIVAFNEVLTGGTTGNNDTVYIGTDINNLSIFNPTSGTGFDGLPGTQYISNGGGALSIDYIDISPPNDVSSGGDILISINGTIYVKPAANTLYSIGVIQGGPLNGQQMAGLTGPARFYFDIIENASAGGTPVCPAPQSGNVSIQCPSVSNISFIGPFETIGASGPTIHYDQVLQFSGNVAGVGLPIDEFGNIVEYRVFDYYIYSPTNNNGPLGTSGMPGSIISMLANAYIGDNLIDTVVSISNGGTTTLFPYRISNNNRSVATNNNVYILSISSCN